jgi:hypothetical protein
LTIRRDVELAAGFSAYADRRYEDAHFIFRDVALSASTSRSLQSLAVDSALFMLMKARATKLFPFALEDLPDTPSKKPHLASFELFMGNIDEFWLLVEQCENYNEASFGPWSRGINSLPKKDWWRESSRRWNQNMCNFPRVALVAPRRDRMCIFSCDSNYLLEFSSIPLSSAESVNWDCHFHFHVVNPNEATLALSRELSERYCVSFTFEKRSFASKAYFASARYAVAEQALREFKVPVWIMDVDLKFLRSPEKNFSEDHWDTEKIGVRFTRDIALPWQKMTANAMYVPANDAGLEYLSCIRSFLELHFTFGQENHQDLWWIDQNAIYFALLECGKGDMAEFQFWGPRLQKTLSLPRLFEPRKAAILSR